MSHTYTVSLTSGSVASATFRSQAYSAHPTDLPIAVAVPTIVSASSIGATFALQGYSGATYKTLRTSGGTVLGAAGLSTAARLLMLNEDSRIGITGFKVLRWRLTTDGTTALTASAAHTIRMHHSYASGL